MLTFDQVLENGIAPSREKAQKTRPVLSCEPTMHGPRAIQSMNVKAKAPPTVVVAWKKSSARGRPVEVFARAVQSCTEYISVMRYVRPVTKAMDRVIAFINLVAKYDA